MILAVPIVRVYPFYIQMKGHNALEGVAYRAIIWEARVKSQHSWVRDMRHNVFVILKCVISLFCNDVSDSVEAMVHFCFVFVPNPLSPPPLLFHGHPPNSSMAPHPSWVNSHPSTSKCDFKCLEQELGRKEKGTIRVWVLDWAMGSSLLGLALGISINSL